MYAVIFRARLAELDDTYFSTAEKLRALAMEEYGCKEFVSTTEGDSEIAISYWDSEEQIRQWKSDSEHLLAQGEGRAKWYQSYHIQVVKIVREYTSSSET